MNRWNSFVILILLVVAIAGCQTAEPESVEVPVAEEEVGAVEAPIEPAVFPSLQTDVLTHSSEVNGRDYVVYVTLPMSYEISDMTYPVLYVTDGDFYTIPTAMTAGQLAYGREMPEAIVVGIGYGGSALNSMQRREEDLTPNGSASFLQFLQEELIPDIESNYRVDPSVRTLMGHSSGGTFGLYALFNAPDTFGQIVASSPSCAQACSAIEDAYAEAHDKLSARLFMSVGELDQEYLPGVELFAEALEAGEYSALAVEWPILDGETHLSARPRAFTTGMKWVFAGDSE